MTAAGLVVTDLSHLGVGLNDRGDFRGPVRFAVSSKLSRPSRRCDLCINVVRWVGECGESYPLISPARGRTCGGLVPVVMGSPADRDAGGRAGWWCGSRGAAARRSRCAPGCFVLIGLVVAQRHASGAGAGLCVVFHRDSVDCAAPRVGDLPASGTYTAGAGSQRCVQTVI